MCLYCELKPHTPNKCFYLSDTKLATWKPDPSIWCYFNPFSKKPSQNAEQPAEMRANEAKQAFAIESVLNTELFSFEGAFIATLQKGNEKL
jgi:hypothetical protein